MSKKVKIRTKRPWIAYAGSTIQQSYGELLDHGYLLWNIEKNNVDAQFHVLSNPGPYVNLEWMGSVEETLDHASKTLPHRCRIRVRASEHISQKDVQLLTSGLNALFEVIEVTFKIDAQRSASLIATADDAPLQRDDLRNADILLKLIKSYYGQAAHVTDVEWESVRALVMGYVSSATSNEDVTRNVKWSLRRLAFDNTFGYGEGNVIDFDKLSGIVGIFAPNRAGKSSVVGTMMYALHNTTDRGPVKNVHLINVRKSWCKAVATINVDGVDYIIERQTVKSENKKGQVSAPTTLNVFRVMDQELQDLVGEQRIDTERVIRGLIGMPDDFTLTSLSPQEEINQFINHGSTKRRQILSKFLDVDVFDKMHELVNRDASAYRSQLKLLPTVTQADIDDIEKRLKLVESDIEQASECLIIAQHEKDEISSQLKVHGTFIVTDEHLTAQKNRVATLQKKVESSESRLRDLDSDRVRFSDKLEKIVGIKSAYDVTVLRARVRELQEKVSSVRTTKAELDKENTVLKQQRKSLSILSEVPCGDSFPSCKFIKDAHANRALIDEQAKRVDDVVTRLTTLEEDLVELNAKNHADQLKKIEQILELESKLKLDVSKNETERARVVATRDDAHRELSSASDKLSELLVAAASSDMTASLELRARLQKKQQELQALDAKKMKLTLEKGRLHALLESKQADISQRDELLNQLKLYELITGAFSKKAIPSLIVNSQLPLINDEIAKILHGIVDFTIELEFEGDNDFLEVYINYGDSRRPIELGSGMEKMIASLSIRVALIKVSSLPKSDMLIIDEGFGALDASGVEACNRMLVSLKEHFRLCIIVTHVEGIKDVADIVLDITKEEKDSRLVYVGD